MAFIAKVDHLPQIRRSAYAPGNTGSGTPKPVEPPIITPVGYPIRPPCIAQRVAYPRRIRNTQTGPRGRPFYPRRKGLCQKINMKWYRNRRYASNGPVGRMRPISVQPVGMFDRNPRPISGNNRPSNSHKRIRVLRQNVIES